MSSSPPGCIRAAVLAAALVLGAAAQAQVPGDPKTTQGALLPKDSAEAATFRGGLVYANYCVTCHGINADGNGRAARLYNPKPANLRSSDKNDAYYGLIIRKGGSAVARSEFMPAWDAEPVSYTHLTLPTSDLV